MAAIRRCQRLDLVEGSSNGDRGGGESSTVGQGKARGGWGWGSGRGRKTNELRAQTLMEQFLQKTPVSVDRDGIVRVGWLLIIGLRSKVRPHALVRPNL